MYDKSLQCGVTNVLGVVECLLYCKFPGSEKKIDNQSIFLKTFFEFIIIIIMIFFYYDYYY